ncbi:MAG: phage tail tube protein [Sphaerochaeta sp.]
MGQNKTITNEKVGVYLKVTKTKTGADVESPKFYRLGEGITTFTPANNGQISTKHYINDRFGTSRKNGLQKQFAYSGDRVLDNKVNDFLFTLSEMTGSDVETELLIVNLFEPTTGEGTTTFPAKKYNVMVDVGNDGSIEGGQDVAIDGTIHVNGDPVKGTATITPATSGEEEYATFSATS